MKLFKQLTIVFLICMAGEVVAAYLPFPFPAAVAALLIMLGLFISGVLKPQSVQDVAEYLLANMAFLFVPSVWQSWMSMPPFRAVWYSC